MREVISSRVTHNTRRPVWTKGNRRSSLYEQKEIRLEIMTLANNY